MPSQEDLALFANENMECIIFPIFCIIFLYFPGFILANTVPFLYVNDFYSRQISYIILSMLTMLGVSIYEFTQQHHLLNTHKITASEEDTNQEDTNQEDTNQEENISNVYDDEDTSEDTSEDEKPDLCNSKRANVADSEVKNDTNTNTNNSESEDSNSDDEKDEYVQIN